MHWYNPSLLLYVLGLTQPRI